MAVLRIKVDDASVDVGDLPFSVFVEIEKVTGVRWIDLWNRPQDNAVATVLLIRAAYDAAGKPCPDLTPNKVAQILVVEAGDETPEAYEGGLPAALPDGSPLEESDPPIA